jgi:maleylacetoacetate isomerase
LPLLATEFERLNPIKYVPALVDGDTIVADSFAILQVRHACTYTDDVQ